MIIAQISDTHITPEGHLAYRRVDTAASLARAVEHVSFRRREWAGHGRLLRPNEALRSLLRMSEATRRLTSRSSGRAASARR